MGCCLAPALTAEHPPAWRLVQGQRAEARVASAAEMLLVQLRRTSASSLVFQMACARLEISVCTERMRSPAPKPVLQFTMQKLSVLRVGVRFPVEPKGHVASFPRVSGADSEGNKVLNPVGARTQPCSAMMPSETTRPASNPTHQLPCGRSQSGLRFRKRY